MHGRSGHHALPIGFYLRGLKWSHADPAVKKISRCGEKQLQIRNKIPKFAFGNE